MQCGRGLCRCQWRRRPPGARVMNKRVARARRGVWLERSKATTWIRNEVPDEREAEESYEIVANMHDAICETESDRQALKELKQVLAEPEDETDQDRDTSGKAAAHQHLNAGQTYDIRNPCRLYIDRLCSSKISGASAGPPSCHCNSPWHKLRNRSIRGRNREVCESCGSAELANHSQGSRLLLQNH